MDKISALHLLNLEPGATRPEAKKAFRQLAKSCHPDRFAGRPGAEAAEERMKKLNQAFELLMRLLPEDPGKAAPDPSKNGARTGPESREQKKGGIFSVFRRRPKASKPAGARGRSRPARAPETKGSKRGAGAGGNRPLRAGAVRRRRAGRVSFESVLNRTARGEGESSVSGPPSYDAYSRYVRLKHHMRVQRRKSGQSVVSRVEKISPVRPVSRVGDE